MRRNAVIVGAVAFSIATALGQAFQAGPPITLAAVAGSYLGKATSVQGEEELTATLRLVDGRLVGTVTSSDGPIAVVGVSITGDRIVLTLDMGGAAGTITGTVGDGRIDGEWALGGMGGKLTMSRTGDAGPEPASTQAPAEPPRFMTHARLEIVVPDFPAEGLILDIGGGGEGVIGQLKGQQVVAVDLSRRELDEAPGRPLLKIVMDARDLRFVDASFRTATVFFTFMYIDPADHETVFREIHRVLGPGGQVLVWDAIFPVKRDPAHANILFPLHVKLPSKEINTGYGVRFREGQNADHFVALAQKVGFRVESHTNEAGWFFLALRKVP